MIIEGIRTYFLDCPLIETDKRINVDYLGVEAIEYTIDPVPTTPVTKSYSDGGSIRQFTFIFASREYYGADVIQNMENSGFYQRFSEWIEEQDMLGNYPDIGEGKQPTEISVNTLGYLFDSSETHAKYQIQCNLEYYQEA